jgi:hypothetical protein
MSEWGRVADDGTVYVTTADGERAVGSWQAGSPEEGLALFVRRYEQLSTEVSLLEQRLRAGAGEPNAVRQSAQRLKTTVPTASAVGDLAGLETRIDGLLERTEEAAEQAKVKKAEARERAAEQKAGLADEAETLSTSSEWKLSGERLRTIGDDWKRLPHLDKKADDELWQRVAAARKRFAERRSAHFAALEEQREVSKGRKERLISQAEALQASTDWKTTADRFKQLMTEWKTAGRAPREVEDQLWGRFKSAQDTFFQARSAAFSEQDEELRGNQKVKEEILAEAEQIDASAGLDKAKGQLRRLQERWEGAGKVPRDVMRPLEDRMAAVEDAVREADGARFAKAEESPFLVRLREKVAELEVKLDKARTAGRPTDELEAALTTQRQWLAQAGGGASGSPDAAPPQQPKKEKRSTTAWVRADS